ncbi:MAG: hypothetical protein OXI87_23830, partial [Albidovulum sp.]|nr:hypothetical protein [Albidovulum sp.]
RKFDAHVRAVSRQVAPITNRDALRQDGRPLPLLRGQTRITLDPGALPVDTRNSVLSSKILQAFILIVAR